MPFYMHNSHFNYYNKSKRFAYMHKIQHLYLVSLMQAIHCTYCFTSGGPQFPSVYELFIHYVKNQISVFEHNRIFLKRPICTYHDEHFHDEIHSSDVVLEDEPICTGAYQDIYMAVLKISGRCVTVQKCNSDYMHEQWLAGAEILKKCSHENIAEFVGVCKDIKPMYIITELMFGGNLVHYLQENKSSITESQLTTFCLQAASGMEYLTSMNYVHRNLQAASCMVDKFGKNVSLKISDFHMAKKTVAGRFVSDKNEAKNFAIKWTAPEVRILYYILCTFPSQFGLQCNLINYSNYTPKSKNNLATIYIVRKIIWV